MILEEINTIALRTEAPDHISTWKQFSKSEISLFHTLSIFRQLASAVECLNENGIIHRDVHPTRLHMHNGILKFNIFGLPYNLKKLMTSDTATGHLNFTAPEQISERNQIHSTSDTWSLGCCLYYLITKQDPFQGRNISETKQNILQLRLDSNDELKYHKAILSKLVY